MTVTSIAAASLSTVCAICARPARHGAKLCVQCQAAVKRARQVPSVHSEFLPQTAAGTDPAGRGGGGDRRTMPARRAMRVGLPPVPGGWGTYATLIAFGAAVSITGYFASGKQEEESNRERVSLAARTASVADTRNESGSRAQPPALSHAAEEGVSGEDVIAQIEWTVPQALPARSAGGLPARKPVRDARSAGNGSKPTKIDARHLDLEPQPAQTFKGETAAALPAVVPMPETQAPPIPDRWQVLAAAVSRCERENALVGFVCKERARLQYCEGHWGEAPQCPTVTLSNNTR